MESKLVSTPRMRFTDENNESYPEWEEKKLGEVVEIVGGGTPDTKNSAYWDGDIEWFSPTEIGGKRLQESVRRISSEGLSNSSAKLIPKGSILLTTRATIGRMTLTDREVATNQGFQNLVPNTGRILSKYILGMNELLKSKCLSKASGSTFLEISKKQLSLLPIPLPSLPEQEKIGEFLSALDDEVEQAERLVSLLSDRKRAYAQRIFDRTLRFHDDNGNPYPEWEEKKLGELGKVGSGVGFPNRFQGKKDGAYPFFKVSDMNLKGNSTTMNLSNHTVSDADLAEMKVKLITSPSIVFAKVGAAIFLERKRKAYRPFLLDNNMMYFTPINGISIGFCYSFLQTIQLSSYSQTGALPSYNSSDIQTIKVPLPSLPEQEKIGSFLSALDDEIEEAKRELELLKEQKKAYAQRIFGV